MDGNRPGQDGARETLHCPAALQQHRIGLSPGRWIVLQPPRHPRSVTRSILLRKVCIDADIAPPLPQPGISRSASARAATRFMDACIMRRRLASELRITHRRGSLHSSSNEQSAEQQRSPAIADLSATGFRVYDDSVSAISQPQTPQNLPEHRHRSMLLGMYTAPAGTRDLQNIGILSRRRRAQRSPSPSGLQSPGFRGLYGGVENSDDSALFEQAERRLEGTGLQPGF